MLICGASAWADITESDNPGLYKLIVGCGYTPATAGTFTTTELENITSLNTSKSSSTVKTSEITELSGINQLTNLETLIIDDAFGLTGTLDLSDCVNLQWIELQRTNTSTSLTKIIFPASSTNLTTVLFGNCTGITSLDSLQNLLTCTNLEYLDLSGTKLAADELNLTSLKNLKCLDMNYLTSVKKLILTTDEETTHGLVYLNIAHCNSIVGDDTFQSQLKKLTSLRELNMNGCVFPSGKRILDLTALVSLEALDFDGPGYKKDGIQKLTLSEANSNLKFIDCHGQNISTLYVPNSVTFLRCGGAFSSINDLQNFKNATGLICLDIQGMFDSDHKDKKETLDLSSLTNLQFVDIGEDYFASITGLDKIGTNLLGLDCSKNSLTTLDVSENTNLKVLNCNQNKNLGSIDVSSNANLLQLGCSNCGLTQLNLSESNNPKLTALNCANNQFETLTVPSTVTALACNNNKLTTLDLTNLNKENGIYKLSSKSNYYYFFKSASAHIDGAPVEFNITQADDEVADAGVSSSTTDQQVAKTVGVLSDGKLYVKIPTPSITTWTDSTNYQSFSVNGESYDNSAICAITDDANNYYLEFSDEVANSKALLIVDGDTSKDVNITYTYLPFAGTDTNLKDISSSNYKTNTEQMEVTISVNAYVQKINQLAHDKDDTSSYYATLYLPDNRDIVTNMERTDCHFYTITESSDILGDNSGTKTLTLTEVSDLSVIPTGTALVVKAPSPNVLVYNKTTADATTISTDNYLKGSFTAYTPDGTIYTLGINEGSIGYKGRLGFWKYLGTTLPPYCGYLSSVDFSSASKGFVFSFADGGTTGISGIDNAAEDSEANAIWYNVNGIRLQGQPSQPGIYIKNNKKVVIGR